MTNDSTTQKTRTTQKTKKTMTYEESMARIEQIVRQIESGEMNIDDLAKNLKEAQELIKSCKDKLTKVEEDIKQIMQ